MGLFDDLRSKMSGPKASPLRTPFVATLVVLIIIWSMLSLDMTSVTAPTMVDPTPATQQPPELDVTSEEDLRKAAEAAAAAARPDVPVEEETPVVEVLPTPTPETKQPEGAVKEPHDTDAYLGGPAASKPTDKPLILFAYSESANARANIEFFIAHALHDAADFIFIINGETDVEKIIPTKPNIKYVKRENDCYDLGAYAEILLKNDTYKGYKRFITLNASIRGPFLPSWSNGCWSDLYLNKVTDEVKLVGMTANCWPTFHIQSMIWATDIIGLETLLFPPKTALEYLATHRITLPPTGIHDGDEVPTDTSIQTPGINGCFHNWDSAVAAEVSSSALIKAAGFKIDAMMNAMGGEPGFGLDEQVSCAQNGDVLWNGGYWGTNVNVFETIFMKSNRDVDFKNLEMQTKWMKGRGYSSYDYCKI